MSPAAEARALCAQVGGLLCQSAYRDRQFRLTVGVGLNLSNREPTTCVDAAIEAKHHQLGLPDTPTPLSPEVYIPSLSQLMLGTLRGQ